MKIRYILFLCVFAFSLSANETTNKKDIHIVKIDELVKLALKHSLDIKISKLDFDMAKKRSYQSISLYLPKVNVVANTAMNFDKTNNANSIRGSVGATQLLYDFGKTWGRINASKQEQLATKAKMQQIISDKILAVKQIYYEILKTKSITKVQQKNVSLQEKQLYRAKKYLKSGIKTIIDVSDAKVKLQQAKLDLKNTQYKLSLLNTKLENIIGITPYDGNYKLYYKELKTKNLSQELPDINSSLNQLVEYGYKHRYILKSLQYYIQKADANIDSIKGNYYPSFSLDSNYQIQPSSTSGANVAINMKWNIFSSFSTNSKTQEAKIYMLKAISQLQKTKLQLKQDIQQAYISLNQKKDNVLLSENISKASYEKFVQAQKRYKYKMSDFIELQDAQKGYIKSLSDVARAYYDYFIATAKIEHAIGK